MAVDDIRLAGVKIGEWHHECAVWKNEVHLTGPITYRGTLEISTGPIRAALEWLGELLSDDNLKEIIDTVKSYVPEVEARVSFAVEPRARTLPCREDREQPLLNRYSVVLVIGIELQADVGPLKGGSTVVIEKTLVSDRERCNCASGRRISFFNGGESHLVAIACSPHPALNADLA